LSLVIFIIHMSVIIVDKWGNRHVDVLFVMLSVVDGDDLSNYDMADEMQQQTARDSDTLNELHRELTSHNLGSY